MKSGFGTKQVNMVSLLEPAVLNIAYTITLYMVVQLSARRDIILSFFNQQLLRGNKYSEAENQ
jgi:hypothetical protein